MITKLTVRLPPDLIRRAKHKAAAEGLSLNTLVEDGLHRVLNERTPAPARTLPRVSTATGGLMPGIDLDNSAALQRLEDLD